MPPARGRNDYRPVHRPVIGAWSHLPVWWNWRVSGHFRAGSLGSVWALVLFSPALGPLLAPLAAGRFVLSTMQLILNRRLGRRHPIEGRTRFDWALLALAFLGSCLASVAQGSAPMAIVLMPVVVPFSAIQVRMCMRSYRAHGALAASRGPRLIEIPATDVARAA